MEVYKLMSCTEKVSSGGCDLNVSSNSKTIGHEMVLVIARYGGVGGGVGGWGEKVINMVVMVQADLSSKGDRMSSGKFVEKF